ncbi:unnamed protein product [Lymnaea stagnalis]|uniref:ARF7 effector protein C-terminal domain-containing protein n=1 Tax=Lymnaea stagnalis TaxID=6523 RepID=A0AAV2HVG4_LYMST
MDNEKSSSNSSPPNSQIIDIHDSDSNESTGNEGNYPKDKTNKTSQEPVANEQILADDIARPELKKLSLDMNGTFMVDFDPEKSKREMRKMNRRIYSKESRKTNFYDDKGLLLEAQMDLCDCLHRDCPGCHFPCPRCNSSKCGTDCRCNRKYTIDLIEVEGTDMIYNYPL